LNVLCQCLWSTRRRVGESSSSGGIKNEDPPRGMDLGPLAGPGGDGDTGPGHCCRRWNDISCPLSSPNHHPLTRHPIQIDKEPSPGSLARLVHRSPLVYLRLVPACVHLHHEQPRECVCVHPPSFEQLSLTVSESLFQLKVKSFTAFYSNRLGCAQLAPRSSLFALAPRSSTRGISPPSRPTPRHSPETLPPPLTPRSSQPNRYSASPRKRKDEAAEKNKLKQVGRSRGGMWDGDGADGWIASTRHDTTRHDTTFASPT
jgi:hypothetical protein